ncbi:MAG TPA: ABC transporter ATP-binding protein [Streptosporangiaceae bacterium]
MTSLAPLAECASVTRRFGRFTAVDQVSLRVGAGEIVGLLGANGAGKTTLIRLLLGLLHPSAGRVALLGSPPSRDTRRRIGYVPQGLGLYDDMTPAENLNFAARVFGTGRGAGEHRPGEHWAGEHWAGEHWAGRAVVGALPLGVQRRVAFEQALAHRPDLLILDEPTSGVDPLGRARLWDTITSAADDGAGVLVTTHHLDEAGECSRLVIMAGGRVVAEGSAAEIIGSARVTVVTARSWPDAFTALERAGLPVALAGRSLRVPGAAPDQVAAALGGVEARLDEAAATLEERFFQLAAAGAGTGAAQ